MNLVVALAVLLCRLTTQEAVYAATAGGAAALRRTDVGAVAGGCARRPACAGRAVTRLPRLSGRRAADPFGLPARVRVVPAPVG